MGTTTDPQVFVGKINALTTATQRARKDAVREGALATKQIILATAIAKGVKPTSRIAGGPWGVRFDVKGFNNPTALVGIYGPFHLVDRPTSPHFIAAKRLGRRSSRASRSGSARAAGSVAAFGGQARGVFGGIGNRRGARALTIGGNLRAYAAHPGTKGKGIFDAARAIADRRVPIVMGSVMKTAWARALL